MAQWLRLCVPNAGGTSSIPGGTKILHAPQCGPPKKSESFVSFPSKSITMCDLCLFCQKHLEREFSKYYDGVLKVHLFVCLLPILDTSKAPLPHITCKCANTKHCQT